MTNTSFSSLKKNSKAAIETLSKEVAKLSTNNSNQDDARFWQPTTDKVGNGSAIIRFLPAAAGEETPFVRLYDHGFQGPGGWYIEKSLTTIGKNDPVNSASGFSL